ncbi:hypothetical protein CC86DRAFT_372506 [Ophiobolus disseminans]|uniref:Uncharacterized protein n=1 Tax=Ophiobolus disseminans TaxID=1469910 RepID=A0A6A6ZT09_9PLEO|nr:hypothetical protein CC86DRAFT_372506 [Ophiobolus disseminans]
MTDFMAQQGYGLSAPSSRQDIVSALLSEYGNSFGHGDGSPSAFSPVPADKELPSPPPRSDSLRNKPLPAVARAEQRMSMKFQLRVTEDAPLSPYSARTASPGQQSRKKILYRSLSRDAKPPSLNLVTSNGSTAIVPPTPALPIRAQTLPVPSSLQSKSLPSPPPPPPAKSTRRLSAQAPMGLQQSKSQRDLARNDSLLSQGETTSSQSERPATVEAAPIVKRKALPEPVKRFKSLAELGTGRRGGKGGPLPPTSIPQRIKTNSQTSNSSRNEVVPVQEQEVKVPASEQQRHAPIHNQLPPTPEEDKTSTLAPAPPPKAFTALGLPSNPRAKGGPISPKHVRGKSSTGFNLLMKAQRPAPPIPGMELETITPEMTPSPTLDTEQQKGQNMSPVSPLSPKSDQRRPFSYEAAQAVKAPGKTMDQQATNTPTPVAAPPAPSLQELLRPSTQPNPFDSPEPSPTLDPITAPQTTSQIATLPTGTPAKPSTPPPFNPLTRAPIPLPPSSIPPITSTHLDCYTAHKTNIWSNNTFQPMGCMICRANERDRKWACTWCQLRICRGCSEELRAVEGRNLGVLLEMREVREGVERGVRERMEVEEVEREYRRGGR